MRFLAAAVGAGLEASISIGTLAAMMLPYSMWFLLTWTIFLLLYYAAGLPLGLGSSYTYP